MSNSGKPIIVVSKCLGFEPCRYNGGMEPNSFIEILGDYVDFIKVCPEQGCGLPTPRDSLKIVENDDGYNVVQNKTNMIFTKELKEFTSKFLSELGEVDGFILKSKSPTCGIKDAKIYPKIEKCCSTKKGNGLFSDEVIKKYPNLLVESEGRLTNYKIRERFLTNLYILSDFREVKKSNSFEVLREFHLKNSMLFISYSQKYSKLLDELIYNYNGDDFSTLIKEYENTLNVLLSRTPRYTSNINVCLRAIEQFREQLSDEEVKFIWSTIDKYRNGIVPFSVLQYLIKGYIIRFDIENLKDQTFFHPYPDGLIQVTDSGKSIH